MSVSSFGSAVSGGLPAGAKELIAETFAPTGKYTYTPASPLPAGNYILKTSSCETAYATIGNRTYTSENNQINIKLDAPAASVELRADQPINFADTIDVESPVPLILNPVTLGASTSSTVQYCGESLGIHYGTRSGFLVKSLDRVNWVQVYELTIDAVDIPGNAARNKVFTVNDSTIVTASDRVFVSTDKGSTWAVRVHSLGAVVTGYGNGVWVLINNSSVAYSSTDLITWTNRGTLTGGSFYSLIHDGSKFVVASYGRVYTNATGTGTWVLRSTTAGSASYQCIDNLAFNGSLYMLIDTSGACYTSPDAITWTLKTTFAGTPRGLIWFNGVFAALQAGVNKTIKTSTDGTIWTTLALNAYVAGQAATMTFVYWRLNEAKTEVFVHGDAPNAYVFYGISTDLTNWRLWDGRAGGTRTFRGSKFGKISENLHFGNQTDIYKTSDYGKTWTAWNTYSTTITEFRGWTYAKDKFFGLGRANGFTYDVPITSTDGITWTHVANQIAQYAQYLWGEGDYFYALTNGTCYLVRLKSDGTFTQTSTGSTDTQPVNAIGEIVYLRVLGNLYCIDFRVATPVLEYVKGDFASAVSSAPSANNVRVFYVDGTYLLVSYDTNTFSFSIRVGHTYNRFPLNIGTPVTGTKGFVQGANGAAYFYGAYETFNFTLLKMTKATSLINPTFQYLNNPTAGQGQGIVYWQNTNGSGSDHYFNGMPPARYYESVNRRNGVSFLMQPTATTFSLYSAV